MRPSENLGFQEQGISQNYLGQNGRPALKILKGQAERMACVFPWPEARRRRGPLGDNIW